jgi:hypothetical protein
MIMQYARRGGTFLCCGLDELPRMWLTQLIRGMCYSGYDRNGTVKYLLGRSSDPGQCEVQGIPAAIRDEALAILCDSFDIPERQMYCLRPDDKLMAIYQSLVGRRLCDDMEFERLGIAINDLGGASLSEQEAQAIKTVEDLVRVVAARRGITSR